MARVTVEDCIDKVENRFELVLLAGHRARMMSMGSATLVDRDNDKNPVVALREIADHAIDPEDAKTQLIESLQRYVEVDEPEVSLSENEEGEVIAQIDSQVESAFDSMSEEDLLRGYQASNAQAGSRPRNDD